ncbi:hypothetical protein [Massilia sp. GCM10023247]
MESLLWAIDLLAVLYACRWALRADDAEKKAEEQQKKMEQG